MNRAVPLCPGVHPDHTTDSTSVDSTGTGGQSAATSPVAISAVTNTSLSNSAQVAPTGAPASRLLTCATIHGRVPRLVKSIRPTPAALTVQPNGCLRIAIGHQGRNGPSTAGFLPPRPS